MTGKASPEAIIVARRLSCVAADVVSNRHDLFITEEFRRMPEFGMIAHDVLGGAIEGGVVPMPPTGPRTIWPYSLRTAADQVDGHRPLSDKRQGAAGRG